MRIAHLASMAAVAVAVAAAPATAVTVYTTQASFLAANSGTTLVSFTGLTNGIDLVSQPYTQGGLTFDGGGSLSAVSTNFWGSVDSLLVNAFNFPLIISLAPTSNIGFFLANSFTGGSSPTISFLNGGTTVFTDSPVAGGVGLPAVFTYYGVDGIGIFDTVRITPNGGSNFVSIGEVSFGGVGGVVPEPASWAMLIAGFGLTGAALRRRRISQATAAA